MANRPGGLMVRRALHAALASVALFLLAGGCGGSKGTNPDTAGDNGGVGSTLPIGALAPDFHLPDVNPASPTYGQNVSPRDLAGKISAWYFGHST